MTSNEIKLADNTITTDELENLSKWVTSNPQLTKGDLTLEFERIFADYIGSQYAIYVNSGSSANLLMIYSLLESGRLRNKQAIVPAVSWITTLSPLVQLGFTPHLCESDSETLGVDLNHFEQLCKEHRPAVAIIVHVLGHPNKMKELVSICQKYDVLLLEDACEALGTVQDYNKLGNFGVAGSFSFYYGHHISTIEGGMVTSNDNELYNIMLSIRSHGWSRDVEGYYKVSWAKEHNIDPVRELYTFYYPGFNLRSTDLNAFLGISQMQKIDEIAERREQNFIQYQSRLAKRFYCQTSRFDKLSSFAFGTFVSNRLEVYKHLKANKIEIRPLICGSLGKQPFWVKKYGETSLPVADIVHEFGIYLPNHLGIDEHQIDFICDKFLEVAQPMFPYKAELAKQNQSHTSKAII